MRTFHRWFGVAMVLVFLLTGQYMDKVLGHLAGMAMGPRLLYRSRHIYVLMAALLNLTLGAYLVRPPAGIARLLQTIGSILITIGSGLLVTAFFNEGPRAIEALPDLTVSGHGVHGVAAGVVLHAIAGALTPSREPSRTDNLVERVS